MSGFKKATKKGAKVRAAVFGPSGAGKTFSCLRIAKGLGGKVALLDTERGSASKYADRFDFDVMELQSYTIDAYVSAIELAGKEGYQVLIIDSLSHAWQELMGEIDKLAKTKYKGNSWSAWSEGTPKQKRFINAILDFQGHVLATMRSKTEWSEQKDERSGKSKPVRVGLSPEQGKGIEYEFDLLLELSVEHFAEVIKDRSGRFQDKIIEKPGEAFGKELGDWLSEGEPAKPSAPAPASQPPASTPPASLSPELLRSIFVERIKTLERDSDGKVGLVKDGLPIAEKALLKGKTFEDFGAPALPAIHKRLTSITDAELSKSISSALVNF